MVHLGARLKKSSNKKQRQFSNSLSIIIHEMQFGSSEIIVNFPGYCSRNLGNPGLCSYFKAYL